MTAGLHMMMDSCGEKLCSGCPRLALPAGYFVSPAQSRRLKQIVLPFILA